MTVAPKEAGVSLPARKIGLSGLNPQYSPVLHVHFHQLSSSFPAK